MKRLILLSCLLVGGCSSNYPRPASLKQYSGTGSYSLDWSPDGTCNLAFSLGGDGLITQSLSEAYCYAASKAKDQQTSWSITLQPGQTLTSTPNGGIALGGVQ